MPLVTSRPFTRRQAVSAGITDAMLRRRSAYQRVMPKVYLDADVVMTTHLWLLAALLASPPGAVISHVTALNWYGYELTDLMPLHTSAQSATTSRADDLTVHRRRAYIPYRFVRGVRVTYPARTLVDLAYDVTIPELVQAIEWMLHRGLTTITEVSEFARDERLRGVRRVRLVMALVRMGSESPMESRVRLMIRFAHLPEPTPNVNIRDAGNHFLARGDLVYERWKVLVEYDGWHHERNARQRQSDIGRRERLERAGWRVIVITSGDLKAPRTIVARVHQAIADRGYAGSRPVFSVIWDGWFPTVEES